MSPSNSDRSVRRPTPQYEGLTYDPLFQQYDHGPATYAAAVAEFLSSAAVHSVTDPLTAAPPQTRGLFDVFDYLRWRAGMVAQLAVESDLRKALRTKLVAALEQFQPDILAAHSLGSLITYDLFRNDPERKGHSNKWHLHHVRLANKQSFCAQQALSGPNPSPKCSVLVPFV